MAAVQLGGDHSGFVKVREGVVKQWKRLYESQELKDVEIILLADGEKVMADSLVLRLASPVFEAMLTHDFVERQTMSLQIDDCTGAEFRFFLRLIYTGQMDPVDWPLEPSEDQGVQAPPRQPAPVLQQQQPWQAPASLWPPSDAPSSYGPRVHQSQQPPPQPQQPPPQPQQPTQPQQPQQPSQPSQPQLPQLQQPQQSPQSPPAQHPQQPPPQPPQPQHQNQLQQPHQMQQPQLLQQPQQQPQPSQQNTEAVPMAYSTVSSPPHPTPHPHGGGASGGLFSSQQHAVSRALLFGRGGGASGTQAAFPQQAGWCYSPPVPPLGLLLAAARLAKKYQVEWLLFVLVDVVNQRISEASFERILTEAMRTDLAPVRLCALQFAKKSAGIRERYQASDFSPEIMFEMQAVFPLRSAPREGGDISI